MSKIRVKCAYCGQMAKQENCTIFKGKVVHNIPTCNCLKALAERG